MSRKTLENASIGFFSRREGIEYSITSASPPGTVIAMIFDVKVIEEVAAYVIGYVTLLSASTANNQVAPFL